MNTFSTSEIWERLVEAAAPFELGMDFPKDALLPDIVILRPASGGEVARLRYLEPKGESPGLRSLIPQAVSAAEQTAIEAHLRVRFLPVLAPVLRHVLLVRLWRLYQERKGKDGEDEASHS